MSVVFKTADTKARASWGKGWEHLSVEQRRNAVAFEILAMSTQQDPSVSAERIRQVNEEAYTAMVEKYS